VIATGHCFNDGNKRTAHQSMDVCLDLNGIEIAWETEEVGRIIIEAAQGKIEAQDLAEWLRARAPE
jgi:death-on-curing protein